MLGKEGGGQAPALRKEKIPSPSSNATLLFAMSLREAADYEAEFSQSGAKAAIVSAEKFIVKAITILGVSE